MNIRPVEVGDALAICAIYGPIVETTVTSFELHAPSVEEMSSRIATPGRLIWLVALDSEGDVSGYAYAGKHRERAAYRWSVDTTVYVREDCRRTGVGRRLYGELFARLAAASYFQAFAGITLPNEGSVALHESMGFVSIGVYSNVGFKLGRWCDVGWWQRPLRELETPPSEPTP